MNTKKLNAGIAFLCLQAIDDVGVIDDKYVEQLSDLALPKFLRTNPILFSDFNPKFSFCSCKG